MKIVKKIFFGKIQSYHELLQTSNSVDCVFYDACIHIRYNSREEMLENIDDEIEIFYPIFCDIFQNINIMDDDQILKEKFKQKIISALDFIIQSRGKTYVFREEHLEVDTDDPPPYQLFLFYLKKYGYDNYDILEALFSYEDAEGWVHVLNKIASEDKRSNTEKSIISQRFNWKNLGQDIWEEIREEERSYFNEYKREYISENNEIHNENEIEKYIRKQEIYSKITYSTIRTKIQQSKILNKYELSFPDLELYREYLINECKNFPSRENAENIKNLQKYYYQGYKLPKEEYLALIKLNELINDQIPAWGIENLGQNRRIELGVSILDGSINSLIIRNQKLLKFPDCISHLKNLIFLNISGNLFTRIPESAKNIERIVIKNFNKLEIKKKR